MLKINKLYKTYGKQIALNGLDMEIPYGALYGFVGPNGAGKTTTIKIIANLLLADSGTVLVDGIHVEKYNNLVKNFIGYMPDFFGVYDNLTMREYMEFFASIYELSQVETNRRIEELLELVNLRDRQDEMVDHLSRGMKQRLCLARTLLHKPKLLILDEPASGLEPRARIELHNILVELCHNQKVTILLSSHLLQELSDVCTHIGIIDSGKLIIQGSVKEIMAKQKCENPIRMRVIEGQEAVISILKEDKSVTNIAINEKYLSFHFLGDEKMEAQLLMKLQNNNVLISSFYRDEGNLEEVFLRLTQ